MPFGTSPVRIRVSAPSGWLLSAALTLLVGAVWLEPRGSHLAEPDETRYAEISREMLANGDLVTPRLNGVPYFEKPPLLYWANAAAFRYLGESPWTARLSARLAALATALLLLIAVGKLWGGRAGLAAAIFYLASPLGFALSRVDVTDGLLTFFFAATLLAGRATIRRYEEGRGIAGISALTGAAAAGAMLSKGAVGVVLPGLILLVWCAATGRLRAVRSLLISAAPPVFLLLSTPWFAAMEARHPGFLRFFFVHEHLTRFTTSVHDREEPAFYFLLVFLAGFLCGLPFLVSAIRRLGLVSLWRRAQEELFFILWLAVVIAFFSFSGSKLAPYILPAFPAAAALAGRAFGGPTAP
ncbi:MAG: phospholipid carrier-dependent glycosyltransferase, partial [Thermoanaerobaculia bacterium]|nr:phospholipid carrier-dependent glycosyltransferase [Thermoanaerobaculia bacterium]